MLLYRWYLSKDFEFFRSTSISIPWDYKLSHSETESQDKKLGLFIGKGMKSAGINIKMKNNSLKTAAKFWMMM